MSQRVRCPRCGYDKGFNRCIGPAVVEIPAKPKRFRVRGKSGKSETRWDLVTPDDWRQNLEITYWEEPFWFRCPRCGLTFVRWLTEGTNFLHRTPEDGAKRELE